MQPTDSLCIKNLCCKVGSKIIIDDLSLSIPHQKKVALLGLNGAGKSTLIKALVGLDKVSSGDIRYTDYSPNSLAFKNQLGYQASSMQAVAGISVKEYLMLCCSTKTKLIKNSQRYINNVVEQWELHSLLDKPMQTLSQGNLQKTSIAQAFLGKPQYIFLDEPSQALDPVEQQRFIENLNQLNDFSLCLFSSHLVSEAVETADLVCILDNGNLIALLDLKIKNEFWLVSPQTENEILNELPDLSLCLEYQGNSNHLYKVTNVTLNEQPELAKKLELLNTKNIIFNDAKSALMPLFKKLADGYL